MRAWNNDNQLSDLLKSASFVALALVKLVLSLSNYRLKNRRGANALLLLICFFAVFSAFHAVVLASGSHVLLPANLIKVPRLRQATDYTCGVCALQSVLAYYGEDMREDQLARILKANSQEGTRYKEIAAYGRKQGYAVQIKKGASVEDLEALIKSGRPVICLIQAWADKHGKDKEKEKNKDKNKDKDKDRDRDRERFDYASDWQNGHYVVAVGFDKDNFYFMDPSTVGTYTFIKRVEFLQRWHDTDGKEKLNHFAMVITKDKPLDVDAVTEIK